METNKNFPLPETCKELGEAFPEWETELYLNSQKFTYKSNRDGAITGGVELRAYPAPSFQELWEKLPDMLITNAINNETHDLVIKRDYMFYEHNTLAEIRIFTVPIIDNHVTEAMAQMLLKLKKEGYLDE